MIERLQKKFVIVTMTMLIVVFGTLGLVNYIIEDNWFINECVETLEWIAESGIFLSPPYDYESRELLIELTGDDDSITGILLDNSGNVESVQNIGRNRAKGIPDEIIEKIIYGGSGKNRLGNYVYCWTRMRDGRRLIAVMDLSVYSDGTVKIVSMILMIIAGIAVLLLVSMRLSRFVTEPARKALEREKQFISDASHELKTPVSAISINAQAIEPQEKDRLYVNNIISESARMGRMIERLLTLSRFDETELTEKADISLSEICEEMALTYEGMAFENSLDYKYNIDPDIRINANEDEIRQLLAILIDNAVKNADDNGSICISCYKIQDESVIEVRNTGKGISDEDIPHVFERFYTTDKSRSGKSFGLGLAIAKAVVERHKGKISVYNTADRETVFIVKFI